MQSLLQLNRNTAADEVFHHLHDRIVSLKLVPGTRISEVEIAREFNISRQPVREAFIRLANLNLLLILPQKFTVVRGFSSEKIKRSRFVRMATECEILRRACRLASKKQLEVLERDLENQINSAKQKDTKRFHSLDYDFHSHLCDAGDCSFMFSTISENKAMVDRLCVLSLTEPATMAELVEDHRQIVSALTQRDEPTLIIAITMHLSRLDETIQGIKKSHADYFED